MLNQIPQNAIDGKDNRAGQGDTTPTNKVKSQKDDPSNAYGSLNETGDHTYASINKSGGDKNKNDSGDKNNNAGYVPMTAPIPAGGTVSSAEGDGKNKNDGSWNLKSTQDGNGGEVRKLGELRCFSF